VVEKRLGGRIPDSRVATLSRILVIKLAGIGDLLTAYPALEALRRRFANAEISALVTPQTELLIRRSGLVDEVAVLDKYRFDDPRSFLRPGALLDLVRLGTLLRRRRFDAAVLLHHLVTGAGVAKYAMLMAASGARLRVGLDDGRGWFLNLKGTDLGFGAMHEVEYWLDVVGLLGAVHHATTVHISWGAEEESYADSWWARAGSAPGTPVVAIHPGSGDYSHARRWLPEGFAEVARGLHAEGLLPMIVAGPGEEGLASEVAGLAGVPSLLLTGTPSPLHLAAVLARCRLFIGNDSGVMHVAFASGLPVVAVFGLSNHRAWGPYDPEGRRSRVVRVDLPCSPCFYRGHTMGLRYGCGDLKCIKAISPEMVLSSARELLSATEKER